MDEVCVEGSVCCGLFELLGGGVNGLTGGCEGAGRQHLNSLGVMNFGVGIDHFLSCF